MQHDLDISITCTDLLNKRRNECDGYILMSIVLYINISTFFTFVSKKNILLTRLTSTTATCMTETTKCGLNTRDVSQIVVSFCAIKINHVTFVVFLHCFSSKMVQAKRQLQHKMQRNNIRVQYFVY